MGENQQPPVQDVRAGNADAWNSAFKRYQLPLYAYVIELVHHEQEGLDIVQETFIQAARHIGSLRDDDKFGSWLFGIAHQKCIAHWRRRGRREVFVDRDFAELPESEIPLADDPSDVLIRKEDEEEFMKLLGELPLPQRSVLLLHFLEDFSLEEIARITETQLGTVKSRIHYAKRTLRNLIERNRHE